MSFADLKIDQIRACAEQPRTSFYNESLEELAESIRERGVLEPIVVRPRNDENGNYFEIVMGERRFRASKLAGRDSIPAIIRDMTDNDASADALLENFQREDLNPIDKARAVQRLIGLIGIEKTTRTLGVSNSTVRRLLDLLDLPSAIQQELVYSPGVGSNAVFTEGHARALQYFDTDPAAQNHLVEKIKREKLSVAQVDQIIEAIRNFPNKKAVFLHVSGGVAEQISRSLTVQEERAKPYRIPSATERLKSIDRRMNTLTEMMDSRIVEHLSLEQMNTLLALTTVGARQIEALATALREEIEKQDFTFSEVYTHCPLCGRIELVGSLRCSVCQTILRRCFDCANYAKDSEGCRAIQNVTISIEDAEDPLEQSRSFHCRHYRPRVKPRGMALTMAHSSAY